MFYSEFHVLCSTSDAYFAALVSKTTKSRCCDLLWLLKIALLASMVQDKTPLNVIKYLQYKWVSTKKVVAKSTIAKYVGLW